MVLVGQQSKWATISIAVLVVLFWMGSLVALFDRIDDRYHQTIEDLENSSETLNSLLSSTAPVHVHRYGTYINSFNSIDNVPGKEFLIIVLASANPESLDATLSSLAEAQYPHGITVNLEILIDMLPGETEPNNQAVSTADRFIWSNGQKAVYPRTRHLGEALSWISCWTPDPYGQINALILKEGAVVSPYFFEWVQRAHSSAAERTDIAGITLQRPSKVAVMHSGWSRSADLAIPNDASVILYPWPGSVGFSPIGHVWVEFIAWYRRVHNDPSFEPLIPQLLASVWWDNADENTREDALWEPWLWYFMHERKLFTYWAKPRNEQAMAVAIVSSLTPRVGLDLDRGVVREGANTFTGIAMNSRDHMEWTVGKDLLKLDWDGLPVKEEFDSEEAVRKYIYYADPRWGGLNNHMIILRTMLRIASDLGATLVLQEDYQLWKYLDMDVLMLANKFIYARDLNNLYGQILTEHDLLCEDSPCMRFCPVSDPTCAEPPYHCQREGCVRWANENWLDQAKRESKSLHEWDYPPLRSLNATQIMINNNTELNIINSYEVFKYNAGHDDDKFSNNIIPNTEYRTVIDNFFESLDEPIIATHLRDLSDGAWTSDHFAKTYFSQIITASNSIAGYERGSLFVAYDRRHKGMEKVATMLKENYAGTVVTSDDVLSMQTVIKGTMLDAELHKQALTLVDMWACAKAPDLFIGKQFSTLTRSVKMWRSYAGFGLARMKEVKGVCTRSWEIQPTPAGTSHKPNSELPCTAQDIEYFEKDLDDSDGDITQEDLCVPCIAPVRWE